MMRNRSSLSPQRSSSSESSEASAQIVVFGVVVFELPLGFIRAVWAAYAWRDPDPAATPEDLILVRLLALNQASSAR